MRQAALALLLLLSLSFGSAEASNNFGANCAACHSSPIQNGGFRPGALELIGQGILNLDGSRNDGISRGAIPVFTASPGGSVAFSMEVVNGAHSYAVSIDNFEQDSVSGPSNTHFLTNYTADSSWFNYASPSTPDFFINVSPAIGAISWPFGQSNPVPYSFDFALSPNTPLATYELEFTLAGTQFGVPSLFVDSQFVYLQVVDDSNGDFDDDDDVDGADFLAWQRNPTVGEIVDWQENYGDIASLSAWHVVPEPTSLVLLLGFSSLLIFLRM